MKEKKACKHVIGTNAWGGGGGGLAAKNVWDVKKLAGTFYLSRFVTF
jgi:hypothetical protein